MKRAANRKTALDSLGVSGPEQTFAAYLDLAGFVPDPRLTALTNKSGENRSVECRNGLGLDSPVHLDLCHQMIYQHNCELARQPAEINCNIVRRIRQAALEIEQQ